MAEVKNLSIVKLLQQQFGIKAQFEPQIEKLPNRVEFNQFGTAYYTTDEFGREVFLPITMNYTDKAGTAQEFVLYHAVVDISGKNMMVKTPLTERAGTFKEDTTGDDWYITIEGFLINGTNDFPEEAFATLCDLKRLRTSISMKNAITDLVLKNEETNGVDKVVIEDLHWPKVTGVQNVKPFSMRLVSDTDFNLDEIE